MITKAIAVTREYVKLAFGTMLAGAAVFALVSLALKQPAHFFSVLLMLAAIAGIFLSFHNRSSLFLIAFYHRLRPHTRNPATRIYLPNPKTPTDAEETSVKFRDVVFEHTDNRGFQHVWLCASFRTEDVIANLRGESTPGLVRNNSDLIIVYVRSREAVMRAYGIQHASIFISNPDPDHFSVACKIYKTPFHTVDLDLYADMLGKIFWCGTHGSPLRIMDPVTDTLVEGGSAIKAF
jgi:hypothetical protein